MWSAPVVRDLKIDHTQRHLSALCGSEARNSAVGWHWKQTFFFFLCYRVQCKSIILNNFLKIIHTEEIIIYATYTFL